MRSRFSAFARTIPCYSAAKLFFAYGLNNGLTFPLAAGATAVLMAERPTPGSVFADCASTSRRSSTVYRRCSEPCWRALTCRREASSACAAVRPPARRCPRTSAGGGPSTSEWRSSTAWGRPRCCTSSSSNRPGHVHYGTTGTPVPGYELRIVDDRGQAVAPGEVGELRIPRTDRRGRLLEQRRKDPSTFLGGVDPERR